MRDLLTFKTSTLPKIAHDLGVDMRLLLSDEDLIPHIQIDMDRPPLSQAYILDFEASIKTKLRDILEKSGLTLMDLANQTGIPLMSLTRMFSDTNPMYLELKKNYRRFRKRCPSIFNKDC